MDHSVNVPKWYYVMCRSSTGEIDMYRSGPSLYRSRHVPIWTTPMYRNGHVPIWSYPICGDLRWFAVFRQDYILLICGDLRWYAVICGDLRWFTVFRQTLPGSESSRERKFQGASSRARKFLGAKVPVTAFVLGTSQPRESWWVNDCTWFQSHQTTQQFVIHAARQPFLQCFVGQTPPCLQQRSLFG